MSEEVAMETGEDAAAETKPETVDTKSQDPAVEVGGGDLTTSIPVTADPVLEQKEPDKVVPPKVEEPVAPTVSDIPAASDTPETVKDTTLKEGGKDQAVSEENSADGGGGSNGGGGIAPAHHLMIGHAFGMKVPPSTYSGIPEIDTGPDPEFVSKKKQKKKKKKGNEVESSPTPPQEGNTPTKQKGDGLLGAAPPIHADPHIQKGPEKFPSPREEELKLKGHRASDDFGAPPPDSRRVGPSPLLPRPGLLPREMEDYDYDLPPEHWEEDYGVPPLLVEYDDYGPPVHRGRGRYPMSRRGRGGYDGPMVPYEEPPVDEEFGAGWRGRGRGGRGRPYPRHERHERYRYPDDFDEEDYEEYERRRFGQEEDFGPDAGGYGPDRGGYGPDRDRPDRGGYRQDRDGPDRGVYRQDRDGPDRGGYGQDRDGQERGGYRQDREGPDRAGFGQDRAGFGQDRGGYGRDSGGYGPGPQPPFGPRGNFHPPPHGGPHPQENFGPRGPGPGPGQRPPLIGQGSGPPAQGPGNVDQRQFGHGVPPPGQFPTGGPGFDQNVGQMPPPFQQEGFPNQGHNFPPHMFPPNFEGQNMPPPQPFPPNVPPPGHGPGFHGMPPLPAGMPPVPQIEALPSQETAENLIAQGMNPDLAKILNAGVVEQVKMEPEPVVVKEKKKRKKKSKIGPQPEPGSSLNLAEVPLPPMSIPLPIDVPPPPPPKKVRPPMPVPPPPVVQGPAPRPVQPPLPFMAEHLTIPEVKPPLPPMPPDSSFDGGQAQVGDAHIVPSMPTLQPENMDITSQENSDPTPVPPQLISSLVNVDPPSSQSPSRARKSRFDPDWQPDKTKIASPASVSNIISSSQVPAPQTKLELDSDYDEFIIEIESDVESTNERKLRPEKEDQEEDKSDNQVETANEAVGLETLTVGPETLTKEVRNEDGFVYYANKTSKQEVKTKEQGQSKEPITASQLLEKFKKRQQKKKPEDGAQLRRLPVVAPVLTVDKPLARDDIKPQGKFTFAIRKLKQIEAEQEEEEKQVLNALVLESDKPAKLKEKQDIEKDDKSISEKTTKIKVEDTQSKKEKPSKEVDQSSKEKSKKYESSERSKRSRSRSVERKRRSYSRSVSRERRSRSASRGRRSRYKRSRTPDRYRDRSRSSDRRRYYSRDRSKSRDRSVSRDRRSRSRSRDKRDKKRSLSPWRKDREFFKRYGRMPRSGEADDIKIESAVKRTRGGSRERGRDKNRRSRDRSRDRERSRDKRSRDRDSWDRKREKDSRDRRSETIEKRNTETDRRRRRSSERESKDRKRDKRSKDFSLERESSRDRSVERESRDRSEESKPKEKKRSKPKGDEERRSSEKSSRNKLEDGEISDKENIGEETESKLKASNAIVSETKSDEDLHLESEKNTSGDKIEAHNENTKKDIPIYSSEEDEYGPSDRHKDMQVETSKSDDGNISSVGSLEKMEEGEIALEKERKLKEDFEKNLPLKDTGNTKKRRDDKVNDEPTEDELKERPEKQKSDYSGSDSEYYEPKKSKKPSKEFEEIVLEKTSKQRVKGVEKVKKKKDRGRRDEEMDFERNRLDTESEDKVRYKKDSNADYQVEEEYDSERRSKRRKDKDVTPPVKSKKKQKYKSHHDEDEGYRIENREMKKRQKDSSSDSEDYYRDRKKKTATHKEKKDEYQTVERMTKSKWDSTESSESEEEYRKEKINDERGRADSESQQMLLSRSKELALLKEKQKLEIDISKINKLKRLDKLMKMKKSQKSDDSNESSEEEESAKHRKKDKQIKKNTKREKKKYDESDSESEESHKGKKKKKTKKKKKYRSEDEEEVTDKRSKKKRHSSDELSDTEEKYKKDFKKKKSKKEWDFEEHSDMEVSDTEIKRKKGEKLKKKDKEKIKKQKKYESEDSEEPAVYKKKGKASKHANVEYLVSDDEPIEKVSKKKKKKNSKSRHLSSESEDDVEEKITKFEKKRKKKRNKSRSYSDNEEEEEEEYVERKQKVVEKKKKQRSVSADSSLSSVKSRKKGTKDREADHEDSRVKKDSSGSDSNTEKLKQRSKTRKEKLVREEKMRGSLERKLRKEIGSEKRTYKDTSRKERDSSEDRDRSRHRSPYEEDSSPERRSSRRGDKEEKRKKKDAQRDIPVEKRSKRKMDTSPEIERIRKRNRSYESKSRSRSRSHSKSKSQTMTRVERRRHSTDDSDREILKREKRRRKNVSSSEEEYEDRMNRRQRRDEYDRQKTRNEKAKYQESSRKFSEDDSDIDRKTLHTKEKRSKEKETKFKRPDSAERKRRKTEVSESENSSDSSSESSDSSSESNSDNERSYKTKRTGSKNVQAGASSSMELVPGSQMEKENTETVNIAKEKPLLFQKHSESQHHKDDSIGSKTLDKRLRTGSYEKVDLKLQEIEKQEPSTEKQTEDAVQKNKGKGLNLLSSYSTDEMEDYDASLPNANKKKSTGERSPKKTAEDRSDKDDLTNLSTLQGTKHSVKTASQGKDGERADRKENSGVDSIRVDKEELLGVDNLEVEDMDVDSDSSNSKGSNKQGLVVEKIEHLKQKGTIKAKPDLVDAVEKKEIPTDISNTLDKEDNMLGKTDMELMKKEPSLITTAETSMKIEVKKISTIDSKASESVGIKTNESDDTCSKIKESSALYDPFECAPEYESDHSVSEKEGSTSALEKTNKPSFNTITVTQSDRVSTDVNIQTPIAATLPVAPVPAPVQSVSSLARGASVFPPLGVPPPILPVPPVQKPTFGPETSSVPVTTPIANVPSMIPPVTVCSAPLIASMTSSTQVAELKVPEQNFLESIPLPGVSNIETKPDQESKKPVKTTAILNEKPKTTSKKLKSRWDTSEKEEDGITEHSRNIKKDSAEAGKTETENQELYDPFAMDTYETPPQSPKRSELQDSKKSVGKLKDDVQSKVKMTITGGRKLISKSALGLDEAEEMPWTVSPKKPKRKSRFSDKPADKEELASKATITKEVEQIPENIDKKMHKPEKVDSKMPLPETTDKKLHITEKADKKIHIPEKTDKKMHDRFKESEEEKESFLRKPLKEDAASIEKKRDLSDMFMDDPKIFEIKSSLASGKTDAHYSRHSEKKSPQHSEKKSPQHSEKKSPQHSEKKSQHSEKKSPLYSEKKSPEKKAKEKGQVEQTHIAEKNDDDQMTKSIHKAGRSGAAYSDKSSSKSSMRETDEYPNKRKRDRYEQRRRSEELDAKNPKVKEIQSKTKIESNELSESHESCISKRVELSKSLDSNIEKSEVTSESSQTQSGSVKIKETVTGDENLSKTFTNILFPDKEPLLENKSKDLKHMLEPKESKSKMAEKLCIDKTETELKSRLISGVMKDINHESECSKSIKSKITIEKTVDSEIKPVKEETTTAITSVSEVSPENDEENTQKDNSDSDNTNQDKSVADKKPKQSKSRSEQAPVKRLTRRAAAEQNVVLPPVMTKDMPTRGRKSRTSSQEVSTDDSQSAFTDDCDKDETSDASKKKIEDTDKIGTEMERKGKVSHVESKTPDVKTEVAPKEIQDSSQSPNVEQAVTSQNVTPLSKSVTASKALNMTEQINANLKYIASKLKEKTEESLRQSTVDKHLKDGNVSKTGKMKDIKSEQKVSTEMTSTGSTKSVPVVLKPESEGSVKLSDVEKGLKETKESEQKHIELEKASVNVQQKVFSMKFGPSALLRSKQDKDTKALDHVFEIPLDLEDSKKPHPKLRDHLSPLSFSVSEITTVAVATEQQPSNPVYGNGSNADKPTDSKTDSSKGRKKLAEKSEPDSNPDKPMAASNNPSSGNPHSASSAEKIPEKSKLATSKPHITFEAIGNAIQVIGQENLRRIEVLQRESARLIQEKGNKIEVLGQTKQQEAMHPIPVVERPRPSKKPHADGSQDEELDKLEKEKEELLTLLDTQQVASETMPESIETTTAESDQSSHYDKGDSKHYESKDERERTKDRDRYDSRDRTRDRDYADRDRDKGRDRDYHEDKSSSQRSRRDDEYEERKSKRDRERYRSRDRSRDRSRERERDRERDSHRGRDRRRSDRDRSRERERSRERHKRRGRDYDDRYDRHRVSKRSRSRSWSRESWDRGRDRRSRSRGRRSRSRDRRSRSRERRSRSRGRRSRSRDRRSKSRERRSKSRDRRSRSRERYRSRRSRSRSRGRRSSSRERKDRKKEREKDDKQPAKISALEKFEKELAEKKKILLQPVVSKPAESTASSQGGYHTDQQFTNIETPSAHYLPQPFPVHEQQMPLHGVVPPPPDMSFPPFPPDQNVGMFPPNLGPQFYPEGMPPDQMMPGQPGMPVLMPESQQHSFPEMPPMGPGPFPPGLPPPGSFPPFMDPNFLGQGPPGPMGPMPGSQEQAFMDPAQGMMQQGDYFDPNTCQPAERTRSQSVEIPVQHQQYQQEDQQYDFSYSENEGGFKFGVGGPGVPGHPPAKPKTKRSFSDSLAESRKSKTEDAVVKSPQVSKQVGEQNIGFVAQELEADIPALPKSTASGGSLTPIPSPSEDSKDPNWSATETTSAIAETTSATTETPAEESEKPPQKDAVADLVKLEPELETTESAAAFDSSEVLAAEDTESETVAGKPMKVKSRWRRASEAEAPPPPPPTAKKETISAAETDTTETKEEKPTVDDIKDEAKAEDDEEIPINFELIDENVYLTEKKRSKQMREVRRMVCDCTTSREDREMEYEACGEDCLNRMLFIECGSKCPCGEHCKNKRFQKKQNASVKPFRTTWKGCGLQALEDLEPGQFVMEYVGEVLDYRMFKSRSKQYSKAGQQHFYFMAINPEEIVDATVKGNISRFINHSCDPNCETQKWTVNGVLRVGFFVRKTIKKDEEITFDYKYEVYGKEAQKCYCGSSNCRGWLGGDKRVELRSSRRTSVDELELEKKRKELFDDSDKLEEELDRMSELEEGLRNKNDVLNICRLMVRAEDPEHRMQILKLLESTTETACLRLFVDYHGLPLLWCWMADLKQTISDLKILILKVLKKLPITNKTILTESKILEIVQKWAEPSGEIPELVAENIETTDNNTDNDDGDTLLTPPVTSNKNPVSILSSVRDTKTVKKKVKFADEASSSDSESRTSASEDFPSDTVEADVSSSTQTSKLAKKKKVMMELRRRVLNKDKESTEEVSQSTEIDSQTEEQTETEASQGDDAPPVLEEEVGDSSDTITDTEKSDIVTEKDREELELAVKAHEITALAKNLLEHWSGLKEVYKIPKKEVLEERKKMERELDTRFGKIGKLEDVKKRMSGWDRAKKRKRESSYKDDTDDSDSGTARKSYLVTPPKMSKSERRQLFEAQVKAQDERAAEYQRQQMEQMEHEKLIQYQHMQQLMQDPSFMYYATQDPNFMPSIGIDPQQFIQQLAMDQVLLQQFMTTNPNFPQQLENLTLMYQQAVMQANQGYPEGAGSMGMPQAPEADAEPMTEQHMAFLAQVEAFKQQYLEPSAKMAPTTIPEEEDVPPPPSPPKSKPVVLPPNWKTARDAEGKLYYYHTVTRQTQWDPPNLDTGEHTDDNMDLSTPPLDDIPSKSEKKEKEWLFSSSTTTTAAADTSSEMSRKLKEQFKSKMSSWIVVCLNPFRKQDCKLGRITNTEDFKHLARKLTHHVMAKELKHCRHVEDLEVNENVKSKAKDFVKKYMTKFGEHYKRSGNSPTYE